MALKTLTTAEMIQISAPWVQGGKGGKDPGSARALMEANPPVAGLLSLLAAAHARLVDAQPGVKDAVAAKLADVSERAIATDRRHDAVLRGIWEVLGGCAELASEPSEVARLLDLRDALLPDGLAAAQRSYRDEAGQGELLDKRLTPAHLALLKKIKTATGTLMDAVAEWKSCARALGRLEDERMALSNATPDVRAADVAAARNGWIRAVNALVATLDLTEVSAADRATILKHLVDASARADRRGSKREPVAASTAPVPAPDGANGSAKGSAVDEATG